VAVPYNEAFCNQRSKKKHSLSLICSQRHQISHPIVQFPQTIFRRMSSMLNLHAAPFHLVLERFKASLSPQERSQFGTTTLHDLNVAIAQIQKHQASKRRLQGMRRLEIFLEGMKEYDKVIQVFLNLSPILAFVWVRGD